MYLDEGDTGCLALLDELLAFADGLIHNFVIRYARFEVFDSCIRQHTSAYVSRRQQTSADVSIRHLEIRYARFEVSDSCMQRCQR